METSILQYSKAKVGLYTTYGLKGTATKCFRKPSMEGWTLNTLSEPFQPSIPIQRVLQQYKLAIVVGGIKNELHYEYHSCNVKNAILRCLREDLPWWKEHETEIS